MEPTPLPPPYEDCVPALDEKGEPVVTQQQEQVEVQHEVPEEDEEEEHAEIQPSYEESARLPVPFDYSNCSFNFCKGRGLFGQDDIVTNDNNSPVLYLSNLDSFFTTKWNMTLHEGNKEGTSLIKITNSYVSNDLEMTSISDTWQRSIVRKGLVSGKHKFKSIDGFTTYNWKYTGAWDEGLTLRIKKRPGVVVATWKRTAGAPQEKGRLVVSPTFEADKLLIVCSALAMEKWTRNQDSGRILGNQMRSAGGR